MQRGPYDPIRPGKFDPENPLGVVNVRNDSGADVPQFSVLGINGVVNSDVSTTQNLNKFLSRLIFKGITPTTASHTGKFVVCLNAIKSGKVGLGRVVGVCPVQVSIGSTADRFAEVNTGDVAKLLSGSSGSAQILYAPASTGTQWCWVRLENGC